MFRTVFSRILITFLTITTFILMLQSLVLTQLYRMSYQKVTENDLVAEAQNIAEMIKKPSIIADINAQMTFMETIQLSMKKSDSVLWIVYPNGTIRTVSGQQETSESETRRLSIMEMQDYLDPVFEGNQVVWKSKFADRFTKPMLSIAYPVIMDGEVIMAVFTHTPISYLEPDVQPINRQILTASLIAVVVSVLLVFISSSRITQPLKEMSQMAKDIAKGDLTKRVKVHANDEIGMLAESFNYMAEELSKQEELRTGFVANVSHELRSPLTSIHGFAQGMMDGTIKNEDQTQYLNIIVDETTRLKKLIKELLDLSQIESGTFPLNKKVYDINEQMRRVLIRYIDIIEDKGINVEVNFKQDFCMVCADNDRIEQVLVNLIDNAIKFTPKDGTITLWSYECDGKALVGVNDTGEGIARDDLPFIFERFYKSDKSHTEKKGTGLGLSIVKKIVEEHGHTITVNSSEKNGTSFTFSLDLAQEDLLK